MPVFLGAPKLKLAARTSATRPMHIIRLRLNNYMNFTYSMLLLRLTSRRVLPRASMSTMASSTPVEDVIRQKVGAGLA